MTENIDVWVADKGTIWIFTSVSKAAREWVKEHCKVPEYMQLGDDAFAADWRPGRDIQRAMEAEGFIVAPN